MICVIVGFSYCQAQLQPLKLKRLFDQTDHDYHYFCNKSMVMIQSECRSLHAKGPRVVSGGPNKWTALGAPGTERVQKSKGYKIWSISRNLHNKQVSSCFYSIVEATQTKCWKRIKFPFSPFRAKRNVQMYREHIQGIGVKL